MTDTLKRHHSRAPFDIFHGATGQERHDLKVLHHARLYGAGPRFLHKSFGLGFHITNEMLEDDMYGSQYVPLSLRVLDAGDKLFMKEMGWTEPQYRLWLREVERESEREQDARLEYARLDGAITGRHFNRIVADDLVEDSSRTPLRKDQLNQMVDSLLAPGLAHHNRPAARLEMPDQLVPGQIYPSQPGPPTSRTLPLVTVSELRGNWNYVDEALDLLVKYSELARVTVPTEPNYYEVVRMAWQTAIDYLHASDNLMLMVEAVAKSAIVPAVVGAGAANASR